MSILRRFQESSGPLIKSKRRRQSKKDCEEKFERNKDSEHRDQDNSTQEQPDLTKGIPMTQSAYILNLPAEIFGEIMEASVLNGLSSAMKNRLVCSR